jgi:hypothetical protein
MRWCLQLRVVADEFLIGTQPIFHVVAILLATRFVQTVCELGNLVVCRGKSAAGALSHAHLTRDALGKDVSCLSHDFLISLIFLCLYRALEAGPSRPASLCSSTSGRLPPLSPRAE